MNIAGLFISILCCSLSMAVLNGNALNDVQAVFCKEWIIDYLKWFSLSYFNIAAVIVFIDIADTCTLWWASRHQTFSGRVDAFWPEGRGFESIGKEKNEPLFK